MRWSLIRCLFVYFQAPTEKTASDWRSRKNAALMAWMFCQRTRSENSRATLSCPNKRQTADALGCQPYSTVGCRIPARATPRKSLKTSRTQWIDEPTEHTDAGFPCFVLGYPRVDMFFLRKEEISENFDIFWLNNCLFNKKTKKNPCSIPTTQLDLFATTRREQLLVSNIFGWPEPKTVMLNR